MRKPFEVELNCLCRGWISFRENWKMANGFSPAACGWNFHFGLFIFN